MSPVTSVNEDLIGIKHWISPKNVRFVFKYLSNEVFREKIKSFEVFL